MERENCKEEIKLRPFRLFPRGQRTRSHLYDPVEVGVQKHYVMTKVHKDANILMKRLGYKFIEKIFTRLL